MMALLTLVIGITGWFGIIIWAAWRRSWLLGGIGGLLFIIVLVLIAQAIGGPRPLPYGLLLGLSLFLSTAAMLIGLIELMLKAWTRRRDG